MDSNSIMQRRSHSSCCSIVQHDDCAAERRGRCVCVCVRACVCVLRWCVYSGCVCAVYLGVAELDQHPDRHHLLGRPTKLDRPLRCPGHHCAGRRRRRRPATAVNSGRGRRSMMAGCVDSPRPPQPGRLKLQRGGLGRLLAAAASPAVPSAAPGLRTLDRRPADRVSTGFGDRTGRRRRRLLRGSVRHLGREPLLGCGAPPAAALLGRPGCQASAQAAARQRCFANRNPTELGHSTPSACGQTAPAAQHRLESFLAGHSGRSTATPAE